jgi:hypothetical protein
MRSNSANSSREHDNAEPSAAASRRRCRDWTGAAYRIFGSHGQGTVRTTNAGRRRRRKPKWCENLQAARPSGFEPRSSHWKSRVDTAFFWCASATGSIRARPLTGCLLCRRVGAEDSLAARGSTRGADHRRSSRAQTRNRGLKRLRAIRRIRPHDATSSSRFSPRRRRPADSSAGAKRSILGVPGVRGFPRRQCLVETVDRGEID